MKKAANILYILLVLTALAATFLLIRRNYNGFKNTSRSEAQSKVLQYQERLNSFFRDDTYQDESRFHSELIQMVEGDQSLSGIIIVVPGESVFFNHLTSKDKELIETFGSEELDLSPDSPLYNYSTLTHESITRPVNTGMQQNLQCFFIFEIVSTNQIYSLLRLALIVVAGLFILTLIVILLMSRSQKEEEQVEEDPLFAAIETSESFEDTSPPPTIPDDDFSMEGDSFLEPSSEDTSEDSFDFDFPEEEAGPGDMDLDLPDLDEAPSSELKTDSNEMDSFALEEPEDESITMDDLDFEIPTDDSSEEIPESADTLPSLDEGGAIESDLDFDLPDESTDSMDDDLSDLDFDLPDDESTEDLSLPEVDQETTEDIGVLSNDDERSFEETEDMDFDISSNAEELDTDLEDLDFDLPEEEPSMEEDNAEEIEATEPKGDLSFDLPVKDESEESSIEALDLDLPEEEASDEELSAELDEMDFELPEEDVLQEETMEDLDFDLPSEEIEEQDDLELTELSEEEPQEVTDEDLTILEDNQDDFNSLYDQKTGLSKEGFLKERLEQELNRSSSNNENLALCLVDGSRLSEGDFQTFVEKINENFDNKDLNFQRGEKGVCLMLQEEELDEALTTLRDFSQEWSSQLRIGVSARNGRLLEADQLMTEAEHALNRAKDDKPVIGFRADPDKYRASLEQD